MPVNWDAYVESLLADTPRGRLRLRPYTPGVAGPEQPEDEEGILSKLGGILGWAKEKVDVASNYYSNPVLRNRVLSGAPPVPSEVLLKEGLIAPPDPTMSKGEQYARSIGRGLTEGVGRVITDPVALGLMGGGMGMLPGALRGAAHLGFAGMMAHGMYEGGQHAYEKYREEGMSPGVAEELAKVGVDAGLLLSPFLARRGRGRAGETAAEEGPRALPPGVEPRQLGPGPETALGFPRADMRARPGPIRAEVVPRPMLPEGPRPVPTAVSGEGLPGPPRLMRANVPALPERVNIDATRSMLAEVDNRLRIAVAEGDAINGARLIKLREQLREAAWQADPGKAAKLREPYEKPGVVIDAVQQPQNRPRMLEIRENLQNMLEQATDPISRAKVRQAISTLDAQLRQNPTPRLPPPEEMPAPPRPGAGVPPGAPEPGAPAPALPPGAPAPQAGVPGPPGAPPALPGPAPGAEVSPSAARMAGAQMSPEGRATAGIEAMRQPTTDLVEAANARAAGLPEPMATGEAARMPTPERLPAEAPIAVEGPARGIAARAAAPPVPTALPGPPLPQAPPPPAPGAPPALPPPAAPGIPDLGPVVPETQLPPRIAPRPEVPPAPAPAPAPGPPPAEGPLPAVPVEVPPAKTTTGEPHTFAIGPEITAPRVRPNVERGAAGLHQSLRNLAADRGLTREEIGEIAGEMGLSDPETSAAMAQLAEAGLLASEMRWRKTPDGGKVQIREFYDPTPFFEPVIEHTKAPRKARMDDVEWTDDNPQGSLKPGTIDPDRSAVRNYGDDWTPEQRRVYEDTMARVEADPEWFIQEYARQNTKNGQIVINADEARNLFPEYANSKAGKLKYTSSVHEAASWVAKAAYQRALKSPTPLHKEARVFFTAGGPASGKSAIGSILNGEFSTSDILYDGTLAGAIEKNVVKGFMPALESGRDVSVGFVSAVNPAKYDIYSLDRGLPSVFGRAMIRAAKTGRPVKVQFFEPAHSAKGAPGQMLKLMEHPEMVREAWEKAHPDVPFDETAFKTFVLDGSEPPIGYTASGEPIFPPGTQMPTDLALARLRSIQYDREVMNDAFRSKARELVESGKIKPEVAEQSGIVLEAEALVGPDTGRAAEAGRVAPEGHPEIRGSPAGEAGGVRGPRGRVDRVTQVAHEEAALAVLYEAPRGRITSADLVRTGMQKGHAVQAIRRLEADGILLWDRAAQNYKLTDKGRAAAAAIGERPKQPEPPTSGGRGMALRPGEREAMRARKRKITAAQKEAAQGWEPMAEEVPFQEWLERVKGIPLKEAPGPSSERWAELQEEWRGWQERGGATEKAAAPPEPAPPEPVEETPPPPPPEPEYDRVNYERPPVTDEHPIDVANRLLDEGPVHPMDLAEATGLKPSAARNVLKDIQENGEAKFSPGTQRFHRAAPEEAVPAEAAPEAAAPKPSKRQAKAMALYKPRKMTAKKLSRTGYGPDQIITAEVAGETWHGNGHMVIRAAPPKAGSLVEPLDPGKMKSAVQGAAKAAKSKADPVAYEPKFTGQPDDPYAKTQPIVWLRGENGTEIAVNADYYGHVLRSFPKSEITWFVGKGNDGAVAYLGEMAKPGKHPAAVVMPVQTGKITAPGTIEGAGLTEAPKAVRGLAKYPTYKMGEGLSKAQKAEAANQIEKAFKRGATSTTVKVDGAEFALVDGTAMAKFYKMATGKDIPGSETTGGFLTDAKGDSLIPPTEAGKLKGLTETGGKTKVVRPLAKTIDMDTIKQARAIYKDPFHAFDAIEKSVAAAEANKTPINPQTYEAIQQMRFEAAKSIGLDKVPEGGPELEKFEAEALKRVKAERERIRRERGAGAQADFLGLATSARLLRDAIVLGAKALRAGYTNFQPWASEMGRTIGGGWKGLKHLWRWVQSFFGPGRTGTEPPVPPRPGPRGGPGPEPFEVPAADVPPPRARAAREPGIGMKGRVRTPGMKETLGAEKWQGAVRPGEKPKATDFPINVERLTTDAQMREAQQRLAEHLKGVLQKNRQYRSWAEARQQAVEAGLDKKSFERLVKERGTITDAELEAGRILREQSATQYVEKQRALKALKESQTASPQEIQLAEEELLAAAARWGSITSHTIAAKAEIARAMSIMRKFSEQLSPQERMYQQAIKYGLRKGADQRVMDQLAQAVLDQNHAKIAELGRQIMKPTYVDMVNEFFINNILSAPPTPAANVLGNWGHENLLRTPERWIAGVIEQAAAKKAGRMPERLPGEAFEALKANWHTGFGFSKNFTRILRDTFRENPWDPELAGIKGEFRPPALPGAFGKVWRTPMRALRALDKAARSAAYEAEIAAQVYRDAFNSGRTRGLSGEGLRQFMETHSGALLKDLARWREIDVKRRLNGDKALTAEEKAIFQNEKLNRMGLEAEGAARESTFQDLPGSFTRAALRLRNTHPWLTLFVPFISTPSRILSQAMARTPLGLARAIKRGVSGETRGGNLADELSRGIWGTMISAGIYGLAESGFITGSGPTDPRERSIWKKQGKEPYSVKIGDTWVSMARLEPMATVLGIAADLAEAKNEKKAGDLADKLVATATNNIMSKTYLEGVSSLIEAVEDPERYGSTFAKKFIGAVTVPNIVATAARATDPYVRETKPQESAIPGLGYVLPTVKSRIPGLSRTLPKMRYGTGEPMLREENPLSLMLSPIRYRKEKGEEAALERLMLDVGYVPGKPPKSVTIPRSGGRKGELNQRERDIYARYMREATRIARRLAANPAFLRADPMYQEKMLKRLFRDARDRAQQIVLPSVVRRAMAGGT